MCFSLRTNTYNRGLALYCTTTFKALVLWDLDVIIHSKYTYMELVISKETEKRSQGKLDGILYVEP